MSCACTPGEAWHVLTAWPLFWPAVSVSAFVLSAGSELFRVLYRRNHDFAWGLLCLALITCWWIKP